FFLHVLSPIQLSLFPLHAALPILPTIFVSVFICFSGAAKAQSRQDVGTAEVVDAFREAIIIKDEPLLDSLLRIKYPFIDFDRYPDRKSTRLNSSHVKNSYAVLCLK